MEKIIVPICLFAFTSLVGWILHIKSKADKADVKLVFDEGFNEKVRPLEERVKDLEVSNHFNKTAITDLRTDSAIATERHKMIIDMLENIPSTMDTQYDRIVKLLSDEAQHNRDKFKSLEKRLDK